MGANFTPKWNTYKDLKPFRFWCQKVLPAVYDDSLSYYELLCKVVNYLNVVIENLEGVEENTDALLNAFNQLQGYVNEYFEDVLPQLVDDKLDEMVEDGTFDRYIDPIIEQYRDDIEAIYEQYAIQGNAFVEEAEAWAKGTKDGVDVPSTAPQYNDNSKYWAQHASERASDANDSANTAEAWAVGTKSGVPVGSSDEQYQNNSKYWAEQAGQVVADATYANEAQAWANGEVNGTPVPSTAPQYENNAKYYAEQAAQAASDATHAEEAQAWATGEVDGVPVDSSAAQYENNAKYYAEQAAQSATSAGSAASSAAASAVAEAEMYGITSVALCRAFNVEVKSTRNIYNAGSGPTTITIPGLCYVSLPFDDTGSSTPLATNDGVAYRKVTPNILACRATWNNTSSPIFRANKYLVQPIDTGIGTVQTIDNVVHKLYAFTVFDYTTGQFVADGTTFNLEFLVDRTYYTDNATAQNGANIGDQ